MTLVEVIVVLMVVIPLVLVFIRIQRSGSTAYQVVAWKQDRLKAAQSLLKALARDLEQASNLLEQATPTSLPVMTPMPVRFRSVPGSMPPEEKSGAVMVFRRHHLTPTGALDFIVECRLALQGQRLIYHRLFAPGSPGSPPDEVMPGVLNLDDIGACEIVAMPVRVGPDGAEYLETTIPPPPTVPANELGSVIEISLRFVPPPSLPYRGPELVQNIKVKTHVSAVADLDRAATAYP